MKPEGKADTCKNICPCDAECPIGRALAMVGGKWKMRILCTLIVDGTQRYNDLKNKVRGITPAMLSLSLKEMERDRLVVRKLYGEVPPRVEYTVTERGKQLWPIIRPLAHWAKPMAVLQIGKGGSIGKEKG